MRKRYTCWVSILVLAVVPPVACNAFGHGTRGAVTPTGSMMVHADYDDGEPMAYCRTEIVHAGEERPFQSGSTDRNGRFLFYPDSTGQWRIVVDDGIGHRLALETSVDELPQSGRIATVRAVESADSALSDIGGREIGAARLSRFQGIVVGISLILGVFGVYCIVRQYSERARRGTDPCERENGCISPKV